MSDPNMDKLRQEEEARIAVRIASIPKLEKRMALMDRLIVNCEKLEDEMLERIEKLDHRVRILETGLEQHGRVILKLQGRMSQEDL